MLNQEANRELFEEQVEIIFKAFNEESFSHQGKHYTLPPRVPYRGNQLEKLTLVPRPVHHPVECWQPIVSANPRGLDFMVRHAIKGAVGGGAATMQAGPITGYREAAARAGKQLALGEDLQLGLHFHLAKPASSDPRDHPDPRGAREDVCAAGLCAGADIGPDRRGRAPRRLGRCRRAGGQALHGSGLLVRRHSGTARRSAQGLRRALYPGMQHISLSNPIGTPEAVMLEQFQWLAEEVMPALKPPGR